MSSSRVRPVAVWWLFGLLLALTCPARAYTIASPVSEGCHEGITREALRSVRATLPTALPLTTTRDERALIADLPFGMPRDLRDIGAAALFLGLRDNDLKGRNSTDLAGLALVHGDPGGQREHCLRGPGQREPDGSRLAVASCRAFIRERVVLALAGLDEAGNVALERRTGLRVYLALRHLVTAQLPTYYVEIGKAMHALEDSFTHAYRTPDGMQITVVTNWLHKVDRNLDERRDGPAHRGELDECEELDTFRKERHALATRAATELLETTLRPELDHAQKLAAVDALLDRYMRYQPGCTYENRWCDAPENGYQDDELIDCSFSPRAHSAGWLWLLALVPLLRRRGRAALLLAICLYAAPASADAPSSSEPREETLIAGVADRRNRTEAESRELVFGGYAGGAGSVDHGAVAFQVGGRMRLRKNWLFGVGAEWNPFISDPRLYDADNFRPGAFNGYGTFIFRIPLVRESFNLRSTVDVGFSTILMDLYGVQRGSTGLFAAFHPLGIEWKLASIPYLIVNPLGIALAAPQLDDIPFVYAQYRFTLGIELYARKSH